MVVFVIGAFLLLYAGTGLAQDEPEKPAEEQSTATTDEPTGEPEEEPAEPKEEPEKVKTEVPKEKKPEPKPKIPCKDGEYIRGKGFTWQTEDGDYSLRLGGTEKAVQRRQGVGRDSFKNSLEWLIPVTIYLMVSHILEGISSVTWPPAHCQ